MTSHAEGTTPLCQECANRDLRRARVAEGVRLFALATSVVLAVLGVVVAVVSVVQGDSDLAKTTCTIAGVGVAAAAALHHTGRQR
ncbi:hypothetical protein [Streptomyces erythrochromogenes]|uniref:hypothetical protein n=1 Tax=Streptomyces erythrochromogenes TaxID=285574 RepID=UPI00386A6EFC|nr:hypothetical protein OG364_05085 [Streptomyces erythrochromogenes]